MTSNEDIICVDKTPFDDVPESQRRKTVRKWTRKQFQGKTVENKNTRREIVITGSGIDHTIYKARNPYTIYSMPVLPDMIERAEFIRSEPQAEGKQPELDLVAVERYEAKIRIRGKLYTAELVVKVKKGGNREIGSVGMSGQYYHHDLREK